MCFLKRIFCLIIIFCSLKVWAQQNNNAKPWVFWYWVQAGVSKAGITADLQAMKEAGIGGAYLACIKGETNPSLYTPTAVQLTPQWWDMVTFAFAEAKRLDLKITMHISDGFALAGGPWITPELSMQKVVFSKMNVKGGQSLKVQLPQPHHFENYYQDIQIVAFPSLNGSDLNTKILKPKIIASTGENVDFLVNPDGKKSFKSSEKASITYAFEQAFTCRTIRIESNGNNYQAQRLLVQTSHDGINFKDHQQLKAPRHGWQDTDVEHTYSIVPVTAKYFRFVFDKEGSLLAAEDLDAAKWKPNLKLTGLQLFTEPTLNQYESKNGEVWRISERTTSKEISDDLCVNTNQIINLTDQVNAYGELNWKAPAGNWTILRIGHTSTGHTNATGGGAIGLEIDKFNPEAIKLHFNNWFAEIQKRVGDKGDLSSFYVDSWECGSQNWSANFANEFKQRRGYDLMPFLPVMAGVPLESAQKSEQVLYDVRLTISQLVNDVFYKTLAQIAKERNLTFAAENVSPTMVSDGLLHFKTADIPMGEFWLNSPTHDKPNDMLDAISAGHIYGKPIIQSESFTTVRMDWSEHPGNLKIVQDRNYALGINKIMYHVFVQNPWLDRKPGMTLDGVGLYFQRDQTWWKPGKAWVDYATNTQNLLQKGKPVRDIAVFTGDEIPRRSLLPDRFVNTLPGIFGQERVEAERIRNQNKDVPLQQIPKGVTNTANGFQSENWINPLNGYAYDSFNPDALQSAFVENGRVKFSKEGAAYKVLVLPITNLMNPDGIISKTSLDKIKQLENQGIIIVKDKPYFNQDFSQFGLEKDLIVIDSSGKYASDIAFNHRSDQDQEIYFISNQQQKERVLNFSFRFSGMVPHLYNPVTNEWSEITSYQADEERTALTLKLAPAQSVFVIFKKGVLAKNSEGKNWSTFKLVKNISESWNLKFDESYGGPKQSISMEKLTDWTSSPDSNMKYYSGTAVYAKSIQLKKKELKQNLYLNVGEIHDLASVKINGKELGVIWTQPHRINISSAFKKGKNLIEIALTNTWHNRLMGDHALPQDKRITQTTAPYRLEGNPLLPAGLIGPVTIEKEIK
ncbi:glycosyl hydrolase [Pedobacter alpinus]|uniref:Glycosyl hydrolase n=1 Tax=Pedobacter alpinus TaxID=1590643 RepID=A0ABW5TRG0_9SPHI